MNKAHALMVKTNHYLIKGGELTEEHKLTITKRLLAAKTTPEQARRRFTKIAGSERDMYPYSYVLPYNGGEKPVTIFNQLPKTQILSMNSYELEILRLLCLFAPDNPEVRDMVAQTQARLRRTCFGNRGCGTGECYDAGLVTLRFLSATAPGNKSWISGMIDTYNAYAGKRKHSKYYRYDYSRYYTWYYWLCLSELPYDIAEPEILKHKDEMLTVAKNGMAVKTEEDKILAPIKLFALKNCISRLPLYANLKNVRPIENDRQVYLEMSEAL